jgi:hypothetical protein
MDPELMPAEGTQAACFRVDDTHEYWSSEPIGDDD